MFSRGLKLLHVDQMTTKTMSKGIASTFTEVNQQHMHLSRRNLRSLIEPNRDEHIRQDAWRHRRVNDSYAKQRLDAAGYVALFRQDAQMQLIKLISKLEVQHAQQLQVLPPEFQEKYKRRQRAALVEPGASAAQNQFYCI